MKCARFCWMLQCSISGNHPNSKLSVVGIYRPPDGLLPAFSNYLENEIFTRTRNSQFFVCGDLNIDIIEMEGSGKDLVDILRSFSFLLLITIPTRVTDRSAKCIDHLWYNGFNVDSSFIFATGITDHYTACTVLNQSFERSTCRISFRDHSPENLQLLLNESYRKQRNVVVWVWGGCE